jgi:pimeloyl-ACP methyl ester carboxylesterase
MAHLTLAFASLTTLASIAAPCAGQGIGLGELVWAAATETDAAGRVYRMGELLVPENRADAESRALGLPVKRFLATGEEALAPIMFLAGGPGQSNMDYEPPLALLRKHDVILVGFRGVDGSVVLDCPEVAAAFVQSLDGDLLSAASKQQFAASVLACAERLTAAGVDLAGYTMTEVVDDMEEVRTLMGDRRVNLLSGSYGTRLAQVYATRYPHALERSLMIGVNPPGRMIWDAATTDAKFALWSRICAEDPDCAQRTDDLAATMRQALAKLPERWKGTAIDAGKLRAVTFSMFFLVDSARVAVENYLAAGEGDFSGLASMSQSFDMLLPPMAVWGDLIAKGATSGDFSGEAPDFNPDGTVLGSPLSELLFAAARDWPAPVIAEEYRTVQESKIPTLLVGGELDVSTPPEHGRTQLLPSLVNGHELTLRNLGHVADVLYRHPQACERLLVEFFATGAVVADFPAEAPDL